MTGIPNGFRNIPEEKSMHEREAFHVWATWYSHHKINLLRHFSVVAVLRDALSFRLNSNQICCLSYTAFV
jgi:hypothetical protein